MTEVIICEPPSECADPNVNRWYCMRGHEGAEPGICPLTVCDRRGANASTTGQGTPDLPTPSPELNGEQS